MGRVLGIRSIRFPQSESSSRFGSRPGPEFRTELHQALRDGLTALGLLGWEFQDGALQAKGGLFPWHDESLRELFDRVCEEGVDRVQELFEKRSLRKL